MLPAADERYRMYLGKMEDLLPELPSQSVDVLMGDPPYSKRTHSNQRTSAKPDEGNPKTGRASRARSRELGFHYLTRELMRAFCVEAKRVTKRWVLAFCDAWQIGDWKEELERVRLWPEVIGVWRKLNGTPQFTGRKAAFGWEAIMIAHQDGPKHWNGGGHSAFYDYPIVLNRGGASARLHTTQKPLELMEHLIREWTDYGELVLDPFCGSGTTGVAALRQGRKFLGIEMNSRYYETSKKRLDDVREQCTFKLAASKHEQIPLPTPWTGDDDHGEEDDHDPGPGPQPLASARAAGSLQGDQGQGEEGRSERVLDRDRGLREGDELQVGQPAPGPARREEAGQGQEGEAGQGQGAEEGQGAEGQQRRPGRRRREAADRPAVNPYLSFNFDPPKSGDA